MSLAFGSKRGNDLGFISHYNLVENKNKYYSRFYFHNCLYFVCSYIVYSIQRGSERMNRREYFKLCEDITKYLTQRPFRNRTLREFLKVNEIFSFSYGFNSWKIEFEPRIKSTLRRQRMKTIIAVKVKDGWLVEIKETRHLYSKDDVLKLIRQNNLEVRKESSNDEKIIAD
jgi:hypothetical protein